MIDIMPDDKDISKALNVLNSISDKLRYEKICEIIQSVVFPFLKRDPVTSPPP